MPTTIDYKTTYDSGLLTKIEVNDCSDVTTFRFDRDGLITREFRNAHIYAPPSNIPSALIDDPVVLGFLVGKSVNEILMDNLKVRIDVLQAANR